MASASESRLAAIGRAAPVDSAAAIASAVLGGLAMAHPEVFEGVTPEQATAACTSVFTLAAAIRAWVRSRRRIRETRRAARAKRW